VPQQSSADEPETGASAEVAERIVLMAMSRDAGLEEPLARRLAALVLEYVDSAVDPVDSGDAPELARRLMGSEPAPGASASSVVAAAAVDVFAG
jgi:hypothetical protein